MPIDKVVNAINNFDLKQLSLENVELLQRMVPTEQETKAYREYVIEKKNVNLLTEEDKFLMQLTKVERISAKLSVMSYIGNYFENIHLITPVRLIMFLLNYRNLMYYFIASAFNNFRRKFSQKLKKIEICVRNNISFWKLFK